MSETYDIVDRLRISWTSMTDMANAERLQAADEIERLRAERDQARAEVVDRALGFRRDVHWDKNSPERLRCMKFAQQRGWHDLFSEINAKVDAMNTAKKGEE
jgi:hypothetical protein